MLVNRYYRIHNSVPKASRIEYLDHFAKLGIYAYNLLVTYEFFLDFFRKLYNYLLQMLYDIYFTIGISI